MILYFLKEFSNYRDREGRMYDLAHILLFTILAILSNAKNYKDVWKFISIHFEKLKEVFALKWRKAPEYTPVRNILIRVMPEKLEQIFRKHSALLPEGLFEGKHICCDGKNLWYLFPSLEAL